MSCAEHRAYLAAVADGETELVPPPTLAHVRTCPRCRGELETHQLLTSRLREASATVEARHGPHPAAAPRHSLRPWAVGIAAALMVGAGIAGFLAVRGLSTGQDQVLAAASVGERPPQLQSVDQQAIATWCERKSGRPMPVVALPQLSPVGARFDKLDGTEVVTVDYRTNAGARVSVSWLNSNSAKPADLRVETRSSGGRPVLLVRSRSGSAVVAGDAPAAILWSTAAAVQGAEEG